MQNSEDLAPTPLPATTAHRRMLGENQNCPNARACFETLSREARSLPSPASSDRRSIVTTKRNPTSQIQKLGSGRAPQTTGREPLLLKLGDCTL
jgi:hypothetical protein